MRLTRRVFDDLALWMTGFGLLTGLLFPFAVVWMGMPAHLAFTPSFIGLCLAAGAVVGVVNIALARAVVLPRLQGLADAMERVERGITDATLTGDWSRCDPDSCSITVDSEDAIGQAAAAHNGLVQALAKSHQITARIDAFAASMTTQLELGPLCNAAIEGLLRGCEADAVAILAERGGELELLASHAIEDAKRLRDDDRVLRAVETCRTERLALPADIELRGSLVRFRPREVCFVPLVAHGAPIGVAVIARCGEPRPELHPLLRIFCQTLSVALANALTHSRLQQIAALDPLTGSYNRRFGLERLREEFGRAQRGQVPLSLVMFDIDHFKAVNDSYGHLVGDRVLVAVARAARARLREGDVLVRYGGEEFLAILPGASVADAASLCERVRHAVEDLVLRCADHEVRCTISLGFAGVEDGAVATDTELIDRADRALYRAKAAGRNRSLRAA